MTAEVVALGTSQIAVAEPVADVVEKCRMLLEMAERGDLLGFGFFTVETGNRVGTGWVSGVAQEHLMITGASTLQYRVMKSSTD